MKLFNSNKPLDSGFTLIELMVVIAIIGIFASVTLPSLNEVRLSANSTANNQVVLNIARALLQLDLQSAGGYPVTNIFFCLSAYPDNGCGWANGVDASDAANVDFINQINTIYPDIPRFPVVQSFAPFEGPMYLCPETIPGSNECNAFVIHWFQQGHDQTCPDGDNGFNSGEGTWCTYGGSLQVATYWG